MAETAKETVKVTAKVIVTETLKYMACLLTSFIYNIMIWY